MEQYERLGLARNLGVALRVLFPWTGLLDTRSYRHEALLLQRKTEDFQSNREVRAVGVLMIFRFAHWD